MSNYSERLKNKRWSFSSVNSYENCPRGFYLNYIKSVKKVQNAFAEWGSFIHELLEHYYKGELEFFELSQVYKEEYDNHIKERFPPNKYVDLNESYKESGFGYLDNFEGLPDYYEVVAVEQEVNLVIEGYKFMGYIDLVIRDKTDGKFIVYDHKSKSKFKNKKELSEYARQLYLYSIYIYETYGEYPKALTFNMFRAGEENSIVFDLNDYELAKQWFVSTIEKILTDEKFLDKIAIQYKKTGKKLKDYKREDFFCGNLCSTRCSCLRSKDYVKKSGD